MAKDRSGQRVRVTGGMAEFVGKTGTIVGAEDGLYRVHLDEPVEVPNVGAVRDDLWGSAFLKRLPSRRLRAVFG
jgi:hypothetical protein